MKIQNLFARSMIAASLVATPAAFAADPPMKHDMGAMTQGRGMMMHDMDAFMKSCDMDHDGMMSKAEMMAHMEKMFDRMDSKGTGKLDRKQTESFLKELTRESGA